MSIAGGSIWRILWCATSGWGPTGGDQGGAAIVRSYAYIVSFDCLPVNTQSQLKLNIPTMFIWPLLPVPTQSPFFVNIRHIFHIHVHCKYIYIKEG